MHACKQSSSILHHALKGCPYFMCATLKIHVRSVQGWALCVSRFLPVAGRQQSRKIRLNGQKFPSYDTDFSKVRRVLGGIFSSLDYSYSLSRGPRPRRHTTAHFTPSTHLDPIARANTGAPPRFLWHRTYLPSMKSSIAFGLAMVSFNFCRCAR